MQLRVTEVRVTKRVLSPVHEGHRLRVRHYPDT